MTSVKVCVVLGVLAAVCSGQQIDDILKHDCGATGQGCLNGGTCDATTKTCINCDAGFSGDRCDKNNVACDPADRCGTGVDCFQNVGETGPPELCDCDEGFANMDSEGILDCSEKRLTVACDGSVVTASFTPYGALEGKVYYVPDPTNLDVSCALPTANPTPDNSFKWDFNVDGQIILGNCGDLPAGTIPDQTQSALPSFTLYIQWDPVIQTDADLMLTYQCNPQEDGTILQSPIDGITVTEDQNILGHNEVKNDGELIFASYVNDGQNPITAGQEFQVGKILNIISFMKNGGSYGWFSVEELVAMAGSDNSQIFTMVSGGCVTAEALGVITEDVVLNQDGVHPTEGYAASLIQVFFHVFKFPYDPQVLYDLSLKFCNQEATCEVTCNSPGQMASVAGIPVGGKRRKRRAVEDDYVGDGDTVRMNFTLNVVDSRAATKDKWAGGGDLDVSSCIQSIVFIIPLILLVILVVVAMAIAVYFFMKLNRQKDKDSGMSNPAYKS